MSIYTAPFNSTQTATLAQGATDTFRLTAAAGGRIALNFQHPDGPGNDGMRLTVSLLDETGHTVFARDAYGNFQLDTTVAAAGSYYLKVMDNDYSNRVPGTYAFTTTLASDPGTVYDGADNDTAAQAQEAALGTAIVGTLPYLDKDFFRIHAGGAGALTVAFAHPAGAGSDGARIAFEVWDAAGNSLADATLEGSATLATTVSAAGDYYLRLANTQYGLPPAAGLYTVTATLASAAGTVYDGGSNNTSATALALPIGTQAVGSLATNDTDMFRITTAAGGVLSLDFTHPHGAGTGAPSITVDVIDATGHVVMQRAMQGSGMLAGAVDKAGDYFVRIAGGSAYYTGDEGLYSFTTAFATQAGTVYDGPANESAASAPHVRPGQAMAGVLANGDTDWFAIDATGAGPMLVNLQHPSGAARDGASIALSVIDAANNALYTATERGNDLFTLNLPAAGTYYVKLVDADWTSNDPGQYTLMAGQADGGGATQRGTGAADHWVNTAGNDAIDGGAGVDSVLYYGDASLYTVNVTPAGTSVTGNGGTDTLFNVERLQFGDRTVALDVTGSPAQAYRMYQAAFDRAPDAAGLGYWITQLDHGLALKSVAASFIDSHEFHERYGTAPSNADIVAKFYQNVLHRAPDDAGLAYWADVLDRHLTDAAGVLMGFSESAENVAQLTGVMAQGIGYVPYG